jgi:hypothetical protein
MVFGGCLSSISARADPVDTPCAARAGSCAIATLTVIFNPLVPLVESASLYIARSSLDITAKRWIVHGGYVWSCRMLYEAKELGGGRVVPDHARSGWAKHAYLPVRPIDTFRLRVSGLSPAPFLDRSRTWVKARTGRRVGPRRQ